MLQARVDVGNRDIELTLPRERFSRFTELRIFAWIDHRLSAKGPRHCPKYRRNGNNGL
jgi:hypothetical protein